MSIYFHSCENKSVILGRASHRARAQNIKTPFKRMAFLYSSKQPALLMAIVRDGALFSFPPRKENRESGEK